MQIKFRGKIREMRYTDGTLARRYISVPKIQRHHCDMGAFRSSRRFGSYANSDLFPAMINRELERLGIRRLAIDLENVPECVSVDQSGFLAAVTIEVPDAI